VKTSLLIEIAQLKEAIETSELRAKVQTLEEDVAVLREQKRIMEEKIGGIPAQKIVAPQASTPEKQTISLGKASFEEIVEKPILKTPRFQFHTPE